MTFKIDDIQKHIQYEFKEKKLLKQAFTHSSFAIEQDLADNERLEFLGDSLLDAIIGQYLFLYYPKDDEGHLTSMRSKLVNKRSLAKLARKNGFGQYLLLGKGEENSKGRVKDSNLANAFEALIGAVFIDSNFEITQRVVYQLYGADLHQSMGAENYKGRLQEFCLRNFSEKPLYLVVKEEGLAHQKKFTIEVIVNKLSCGIGQASSKRHAEQKAAKEALKKINADYDVKSTEIKG